MRLIDADKIDYRSYHLHRGYTLDECDKAMAIVMDQHTVEPMQWIPCEVRLPDTEDEVIVSIHDDSGDTPYDYTACGWKLLAVEDNAWIVDNEVHYNIIAWMPLPEPYKGR